MKGGTPDEMIKEVTITDLKSNDRRSEVRIEDSKQLTVLESNQRQKVTIVKNPNSDNKGLKIRNKPSKDYSQ